MSISVSGEPHPYLGLLNDRHICELLDKGLLFRGSTWSRDHVRHASYTLRLGNEIRHRASDGTIVLTHLEANGKFDVVPGQTVMLFSAEEFQLPADIAAFTVARGIFHVEGFTAENTYVDPGFGGAVYTTITNMSTRTITIARDMPIARVFFHRLCCPVENPYVRGDQIGIAQQLDAIPVSAPPTSDDARALSIAELLRAAAPDSITQTYVREIVRRLKGVIMLFALTSLAWPVALLIVNTDWATERLPGLASNIIAGFITAGILYFGGKHIAKWRDWSDS